MTFLTCQTCGADYDVNDSVWKCLCGGMLDIVVEHDFDIDKLKSRQPSMWRYREMLPIQHDENIISFDEGFTPLIPVEMAGREILVKQDFLFPSGSYKDRGAAVLVSKMKEWGVKKCVEDSSGNAGTSIAAYCAKAGIECHVYVPENTSAGKLAQIEAYGAKLHKIPGSRLDTSIAVQTAAQKTYYASHVWNPYFFQGTKTFAYEVCEQLNWQAPDVVILPVGNGTLYWGAYIGFQELLDQNIIDKMPKLIGVQAENCSPLVHAFENNQTNFEMIIPKETLAEGISIVNPGRGSQLLLACQMTKGQFISVSENEILTALQEMFKKGYFIEPTSAATIAGLKNYINSTDNVEDIVSVFTGTGLKAADKILKLL